jgi:hypothetical protein
MSLFQEINPTVPTADQLKAAALATIKQEVIADAKAMLDTLNERHRMSLARVWSNPVLTPDEAVGALGTDAVTLFTGSASIADFLASQYGLAGADYVSPHPPEWENITGNADGTVTLSGSPS